MSKIIEDETNLGSTFPVYVAHRGIMWLFHNGLLPSAATLLDNRSNVPYAIVVHK
jgi:hypothetical protein